MFPRKERALATGIFNSGSNVGAIVAPLVVPFIAITTGGNGRLSLPALWVLSGWFSG